MRVSRAVLQDIFINTGYVVLGTAVLAFGTAVFLIPFDLITGGVSGMAIALSHIVPISSEILIAVISWALFFVGVAIFGKSFFFKTAISTLLYPPLVSLFSHLCDPSVFGGYFALRDGSHPDIAILAATLFGGALVGLGCALSFIGGGSTGGVDVIALSAAKFFPKIKSSTVMLVCDSAIVFLGAFSVKNFILTALGAVSALVCSLTLDKVLFVKKR